jgi:MFS family permease
LLAGFVLRQRTARHPLMPLRVFRSRTVTGANLVQVLGTAGMFGMFFLGSLYLREILHYDPLQIGLAFLPVAVVMGTLSVRYTDRLALRFGPRPVMLTGLALIAAGLALFAVAPAGGGAYLPHVLPVALLVGAGSGLCFPALMTLAMSGATAQDAGLASGLVNTTGQIGGAVGLAVLATVSASRTSALAARHQPTAAVLTGGYHLAFWIACGLVGAAAVATVTLLRPSPAAAGPRSPEPHVGGPEPALVDVHGPFGGAGRDEVAPRSGGFLPQHQQRGHLVAAELGRLDEAGAEPHVPAFVPQDQFHAPSSPRKPGRQLAERVQ